VSPVYHASVPGASAETTIRPRQKNRSFQGCRLGRNIEEGVGNNTDLLGMALQPYSSVTDETSADVPEPFLIQLIIRSVLP
jgi:hypothetical protein